MGNRRLRLRIIIPRFPNFNIYSSLASTTTSVGPIYVGTAANKLDLWDVEIIDENNCHGRFYPRDKNKKLDHKKLQQERPADVAGFYGSITSTIPRLFQLAQLYKSMGVKTVAGGKHVENLPLEALENGIDVVVLKEGEVTIKELLLAWQNNGPLDTIKGIAFLKNFKMVRTADRPLLSDFDSEIYPDFSLLYYAKMDYYPINRTRGCNSNCEFCAVKDRARSCTPQKMFNNVVHLIETRGARHFFETSDHFAANREEAIEFCRLIAAYQKAKKVKLKFTVQIRISDARYPELLQAMQDANVEIVCVGYESPLNADLKNMKKGYLSDKLINWTKTFHKYHFFIHGMFIFGYPVKGKNNGSLSLAGKVKAYRRFVKKAKIDTLQVLLPIPLPGTGLYKRLEQEGRLFPLEKIGWEYYDGQYPLFQPADKVTPEELHKAIKKIMFRFYSFSNLLKIILHIFITFPGFVFPSAVTIILGRIKYILHAFNIWKRKFFRNNIMKLGGYLIIKNWIKNFKSGTFLNKLNEVKSYEISEE